MEIEYKIKFILSPHQRFTFQGLNTGTNNKNTKKNLFKKVPQYIIFIKVYTCC